MYGQFDSLLEFQCLEGANDSQLLLYTFQFSVKVNDKNLDFKKQRQKSPWPEETISFLRIRQLKYL